MAGKDNSVDLAKCEAQITKNEKRIKVLVKKISVLESERRKILEGKKDIGYYFQEKRRVCDSLIQEVSGRAVESVLESGRYTYGDRELSMRLSQYEYINLVINNNILKYEDEIVECKRNIYLMERRIKDGIS